MISEAQRCANKKWYSKNKEKQAVYMKAWFLKNKDKQSAYIRKMKFGITSKELDAMVINQNGACAICFGQSVGYGKFHVDHDHVSGRVRGLLCHNCNVGLGHFKDSVSYLMAAISYLSK